MIKNKINVKKLIAKYGKKNFYVAASVVLGLFTLALFFSNTIVCRNCVFNEGGIKVYGSELEFALKAKDTFYKNSGQTYDAETVRKDTLKELADRKKVENYANSKGIKVSKEELNALYEERIKVYGDEKKLLDKLKEMYGFSKTQYLDVLKYDILIDKVQASLGVPLKTWLEVN